MSDILERHGVPLASNQIEFNLVRQSPLKNGLLNEMKKRGIVCLACECFYLFVLLDLDGGRRACGGEGTC